MRLKVRMTKLMQYHHLYVTLFGLKNYCILNIKTQFYAASNILYYSTKHWSNFSKNENQGYRSAFWQVATVIHDSCQLTGKRVRNEKAEYILQRIWCKTWCFSNLEGTCGYNYENWITLKRKFRKKERSAVALWVGHHGHSHRGG